MKMSKCIDPDDLKSALEAQGHFVDPAKFYSAKLEFERIKQNLIDAGMYDDGHMITLEEVEIYGKNGSK